MDVKYESKYMRVSVDSEQKYIETIRSSLIREQNEEEYKAEILEWLAVIEEEKPVYQLIDQSQVSRVIVGLELQNWINSNLIAPAIQMGVRKLAFVVSDDIFTRVSAQQTIEEDTDTILKSKYFDKIEDAKEWLLSVNG